jgi:biopolymer transport protein ExbD
MRIPSVHQHSERVSASSSMTPMIDVVFLLLVFFVCAAIGQKHEGMLATELGAGAEASPLDPETPPPLDVIKIRLRQDAQDHTVMTLNGREYRDFEELRLTLIETAELAPDIPVVLDIAPNVPFGEMIAVYDTCRAADFEEINIATDRPPQKGES